MNGVLIRRLFTVHSVPPHIVGLTLLASFAAAVLGFVQGWPLWAKALAGLLPWFPVFYGEVVWTYRHYSWLALFYVLVVSQVGHFFEHVAQMTQIHLLGLAGAAAQGVFGALNIEWVHFVFNTWVIVAVPVVLYRFRSNPWLWVTLIVAAWHELEHLFIMAAYLSTGRPGTPGLLAKGGLVGGGLPLTRADLHFLYNLVETIPLVGAFVFQLKRSHDEWLKKAFPHLPERVLTDVTSKLWSVRVPAGEVIIRQGDPPDDIYVITKGEVAVMTRRGDSDQEIELSTLTPGQYFGEIGVLSPMPRAASIRAKTAVELLVLDGETLRSVADSPDVTAQDLAEVVRRHLSHSAG